MCVSLPIIPQFSGQVTTFFALFHTPAVPPAAPNNSDRPDKTTSSDGWFYTAAAYVASEWASANGCSSNMSRYRTSRDGTNSLQCNGHDTCHGGADIVDCRWNGGHGYPSNFVSWAHFPPSMRARVTYICCCAIVPKCNFPAQASDIIWEFFDSHRKD